MIVRDILFNYCLLFSGMKVKNWKKAEKRNTNEAIKRQPSKSVGRIADGEIKDWMKALYLNKLKSWDDTGISLL